MFGKGTCVTLDPMVTRRGNSKMKSKKHCRKTGEYEKKEALEIRNKKKNDEKNARPISNSKLNVLLRLHVCPIDLVVFQGSLEK